MLHCGALRVLRLKGYLFWWNQVCKEYEWCHLGMENMLLIKFGWKPGVTNCTLAGGSNKFSPISWARVRHSLHLNLAQRCTGTQSRYRDEPSSHHHGRASGVVDGNFSYWLYSITHATTTSLDINNTDQRHASPGNSEQPGLLSFPWPGMDQGCLLQPLKHYKKGGYNDHPLALKLSINQWSLRR